MTIHLMSGGTCSFHSHSSTTWEAYRCWRFIKDRTNSQLCYYKHNQQKAINKHCTHFGESFSLSSTHVWLTSSCREGRGCLASPSRDLLCLRGLGRVDTVWGLVVIGFFFVMWPNGLMWWGRFFSKSVTSLGFSLRELTNFVNCQPTWNRSNVKSVFL